MPIGPTPAPTPGHGTPLRDGGFVPPWDHGFIGETPSEKRLRKEVEELREEVKKLRRAAAGKHLYPVEVHHSYQYEVEAASEQEAKAIVVDKFKDLIPLNDEIIDVFVGDPDEVA